MRQEKHLSQFPPVVGKRLMVFPGQVSPNPCIQPIFVAAASPLPLQRDFVVQTSLLPTSALVPPRVSLQAWRDGGCSPSQMIDASPRRWRWGLWSRSYSRCPAATSAFGQEGPYPSGHPAQAPSFV